MSTALRRLQATPPLQTSLRAKLFNEKKFTKKHVFFQPATLELTHNWGTELEAGPSPYHNGNADPR